MKHSLGVPRRWFRQSLLQFYIPVELNGKEEKTRKERERKRKKREEEEEGKRMDRGKLNINYTHDSFRFIFTGLFRDISYLFIIILPFYLSPCTHLRISRESVYKK